MQVLLAGTVPLVRLTLVPVVATAPVQPTPENKGKGTGVDAVAGKIAAESMLSTIAALVTGYGFGFTSVTVMLDVATPLATKAGAKFLVASSGAIT